MQGYDTTEMMGMIRIRSEGMTTFVEPNVSMDAVCSCGDTEWPISNDKDLCMSQLAAIDQGTVL